MIHFIKWTWRNAFGFPVEVHPKPQGEMLNIASGRLDHEARAPVWLSYSRGVSDDMVDRLEKRLEMEYNVRRDTSSTTLRQRILDFEREIGRGGCVIVIISNRYLESIHCMRELLFMHQHSQGDETNFLKRVVPLILEDVQIKDDEQRLDRATFWVNKRDALDKKMSTLPRSALGTTPETLAMIEQFYHNTQPILAWLADVVMPRGIKNIEKGDFAAVVAALKSKV